MTAAVVAVALADQGQRLFQLAGPPKEIWSNPEGDHRNPGGQEAVDAIMSFLARHPRGFHPHSRAGE